MFVQPATKHLPCLAAAALLLTLAGVCGAPRAFARAVSNTIDPLALVSDNGGHIIATGPIVCTAGERAHLRLTVTQRETGAVAEGRTRLTCTGATQQWEVQASKKGKARFEEGPATAVALAHTTDHGDTTDAQQWLVEITLVGE